MNWHVRLQTALLVGGEGAGGGGDGGDGTLSSQQPEHEQPTAALWAQVMVVRIAPHDVGDWVNWHVRLQMAFDGGVGDGGGGDCRWLPAPVG